VATNHNLVRIASKIFIIYADNLSNVDVDSLLAFHGSHGDSMTMILFKALYPEDFGIRTLDPSNRIVKLVEKPKHSQGDLANAGVYVVSPQAYRNSTDIEPFDLEFDVLPGFLNQMRGWHWPGHHLEIGTREALEQAQ